VQTVVSCLSIHVAGHSIECISHADYSIAFLHCDLDLCPFNLILIGELVMDYPCAKFGDFSFNLFGFIVRTHIHRITHRRG